MINSYLTETIKNGGIMKKKLGAVLSIIFLLFLVGCGLFEDPTLITIEEPRERDELVQGKSFMLVADIDLPHGVREINVSLFGSTGTFSRDGLSDSLIYIPPYDSVLWKFDSFDEDVNFMGKYKIEKEIMVPPDVPKGDYYTLQVNYLNWDEYSGYANTVMVSVATPEMYYLSK
jgi:hypothetical protein